MIKLLSLTGFLTGLLFATPVTLMNAQVPEVPSWLMQLEGCTQEQIRALHFSYDTDNYADLSETLGNCATTARVELARGYSALIQGDNARGAELIEGVLLSRALEENATWEAISILGSLYIEMSGTATSVDERYQFAFDGVYLLQGYLRAFPEDALSHSDLVQAYVYAEEYTRAYLAAIQALEITGDETFRDYMEQLAPLVPGLVSI